MGRGPGLCPSRLHIHMFGLWPMWLQALLDTLLFEFSGRRGLETSLGCGAEVQTSRQNHPRYFCGAVSSKEPTAQKQGKEANRSVPTMPRKVTRASRNPRTRRTGCTRPGAQRAASLAVYVEFMSSLCRVYVELTSSLRCVWQVGQHEDPNENPFDKAGARRESFPSFVDVFALHVLTEPASGITCS